MTPQRLQELTFLRRARDMMDRDYALPLDVVTMAQHAAMSPAHFSRRFVDGLDAKPRNRQLLVWDQNVLNGAASGKFRR